MEKLKIIEKVYCGKEGRDALLSYCQRCKHHRFDAKKNHYCSKRC